MIYFLDLLPATHLHRSLHYLICRKDMIVEIKRYISANQGFW
jgi:hypothetical protein